MQMLPGSHAYINLTSLMMHCIFQEITCMTQDDTTFLEKNDYITYSVNYVYILLASRWRFEVVIYFFHLC